MKPLPTKQKHRQLMTVLHRLGINDDQRHDLVYNYTNGRTSSTRELTEGELNGLVWRLHKDLRSANNTAMVELQLKKKRSTVLAIAQRCGIHTGTDFTAFNSFMKNRSIHKKELHKYTLDELTDLVKQFRGLERNYKASAQNPGTKAWNKARGWQPVATN